MRGRLYGAAVRMKRYRIKDSTESELEWMRRYKFQVERK